jgi:hypothetical protein
MCMRTPQNGAKLVKGLELRPTSTEVARVEKNMIDDPDDHDQRAFINGMKEVSKGLRENPSGRPGTLPTLKNARM